MAGANNAQMKARGWKAADITRYRASHSGPMSDSALRRAGALPKKNSHAHKALAETIRQNRPAPPARKPVDAATMARGTRDLGATMMANRKAMAAKAKAPWDQSKHINRSKKLRASLNAKASAIGEKRYAIQVKMHQTEKELWNRPNEPVWADIKGKNRQVREERLRKAQREWDRPRRRLEKLKYLSDKGMAQMEALWKRADRVNQRLQRLEK